MAAHSSSVVLEIDRRMQALSATQDQVTDLKLAGTLHDLGKADPRYQIVAMYHGDFSQVQNQPLARPAAHTGDFDRVAYRRTARRHGMPLDFAHELWSVALVDHDSNLVDGAADRDLVRHLIATHHGDCRPLPPAVHDDAPPDLVVNSEGRELRLSAEDRERIQLGGLDSPLIDAFWTLVRRYGWWGLAWLEMTFRLCDRAVAEREESGVQEF